MAVGSFLLPLEKLKFQFVLFRASLTLKQLTFILVSTGLAAQIFSKSDFGQYSHYVWCEGIFTHHILWSCHTPQCLTKIAPYHLWEESSRQKDFGRGHWNPHIEVPGVEGVAWRCDLGGLGLKRCGRHDESEVKDHISQGTQNTIPEVGVWYPSAELVMPENFNWSHRKTGLAL